MNEGDLTVEELARAKLLLQREKMHSAHMRLRELARGIYLVCFTDECGIPEDRHDEIVEMLSLDPHPYSWAEFIQR